MKKIQSHECFAHWAVATIYSIIILQTTLWSKKRRHQWPYKSDHFDRNGKKQSQWFERLNGLRLEWNVSGAELNGTERSVNSKFVNFMMFLTVVLVTYQGRHRTEIPPKNISTYINMTHTHVLAGLVYSVCKCKWTHYGIGEVTYSMIRVDIELPMYCRL